MKIEFYTVLVSLQPHFVDEFYAVGQSIYWKWWPEWKLRTAGLFDLIARAAEDSMTLLL